MEHSGAILYCVLEVGTAQKKNETKEAFGRFSKNVVDDFQWSYWMSKYVYH